MFTKEIAAARFNRDLSETEQLLAASLGGVSSLMGTAAQAASLEGVDPAEAFAIKQRLLKAQENLINAEADILRVHGQLTKINREIKAQPDEDGVCPPQTGALEQVA